MPFAHVAPIHFNFRYTNREATGCILSDRTAKALAGTVGRRLMYARPNLARAY